MKSKVESIKWAGNIMFHAGAKEKVGLDVPDNQISVTFPKLRNQGGIWRLGPNSPAIDFADGEYDFVATDVDGQPRPKKKDAGSDEFATGRSSSAHSQRWMWVLRHRKGALIRSVQAAMR